MKLTAISFKDCWQTADGSWYSSGGFPLQMTGIGSLFDEVTLVIVGSKPKAGGIPLPRHFKVVPLQKPKGSDLKRKISVITSMPYYWKVMARHCHDADVVHVPLPGDLPLLGFFAAQRSKKRTIGRYGSSWHTNTETTLMNRFTRECMRKSAGGRNVMLVTGEGVEPPAPRMHWIFSTALTKQELEQIRPDLDRDLSRPSRIVYVGRLSPEKGVKNLILAAARLKARRFDSLPQITLAGDGPQRAELEKLTAAENCQDIVQFAGQLDRPRLSELLLKADFCVQPSLTEGYSKAWLDAMAHGLPVLASEVGAARGVVGSDGERGWLVSPGDVSLLAESIQRVIQTKKDWPALRQRCRSFVEGRTLEAWSRTIGNICASQWQVSFDGGKLR